MTSHDSSGPAADPPQDEDELERLRSEVARLKAQLPADEASTP